MFRINKITPKKSFRSGVTLIELLITIAIVAVVVSVLAVVINSGLQAWFFIRGQREFMMDGRSALKRLVKEIRRIKSPADGLVVFTADQLHFRDIDDEVIIYTRSGTRLVRNGAVLLDNLEDPGGLVFTYLNSAGQPTTSREAIRLIGIELSLFGGDNRVRLKGAAGVRNR